MKCSNMEVAFQGRLSRSLGDTDQTTDVPLKVVLKKAAFPMESATRIEALDTRALIEMD